MSLERLLNPAQEITLPDPGTPFAEVEPGCVFHFAYGANMNYSTLSKRGCKIQSRDAAVLADPAMKLLFQHRGGYSTVQRSHAPSLYPTFRSHVHGVLYKLTREEMDKLKRKEGGYALQDMEVVTYDGRRVMAKVFVSGPLARLPAEVKPTERYMRLLREGAADNYLDPLYQAWLSSIETVPSAGLPHEYYDTPAKYIAYAFLAVVALLISGFFAQHV